MPESKGRKAAEDKAAAARSSEARAKARANKAERKATLEGQPWIAPLFITVGLLGVLWLVLYYIASAYIPFMAQLGGWNVLIGMGLMTAAFAIATQWK